MNREQIKAKLIAIFQESCYKRVNPSKITDQSSFISDLEMDSFDIMAMVAAIDDEFGINLIDAEAPFSTVKELIDFLAEHIEQLGADTHTPQHVKSLVEEFIH